jgi:hypothetical protein
VFDLILGAHTDASCLLYTPFSSTKHRPKYKESRRGNLPSKLVGALEGLSVSTPLVTSVVLLLSDTNIISHNYITALFAANINKRYNPF